MNRSVYNENIEMNFIKKKISINMTMLTFSTNILKMKTPLRGKSDHNMRNDGPNFC